MAFFDDFTTALKQKWLQYFQLNHAWMTLQMELESAKTPDGGRRPPSYLILGVLNALEPKLAQLMLPFTRLNSDPDALIEVLDLNFDPDIALGNKPPLQASPAATPTIPEVPVTAPIEDTFDGEDSFDEEADLEPMMVVTSTTVTAVDFGEEAVEDFGDDFAEDAIELSTSEEEDALIDMGLDSDFDDTPVDELPGEDVEGFDDIALDEFADAEASSQEISDESDIDLGSITEEAESNFSAMGLEAWGAETPEAENEELLPDFGDITLDEFGSDTPAKEGDDEDLEAFGDLNFDPFSDPTSKDKEEDAWGK